MSFEDKSFNFDEVHLFFCLVIVLLVLYIKNHCLAKVMKIIPVFYSVIFIVLVQAFRPVIHFKLFLFMM